MKENLTTSVVYTTGCSTRRAELPFGIILPSKVDVQTRFHEVFNAQSEQRRQTTFRSLQAHRSERNDALGSVLKSFDRLGFDRVEPIMEAVDSGLHGPDGGNRATLLKNMLTATDSQYFESERAGMHVDEDYLVELLRHQSLHPLIGAMLEDPKEYRMPLGLLFSYVSPGDYPESVTGNFSPIKIENQFSLSPYPDGWHLCGELEGNFDEAKQYNVTAAVTHGDSTLFLVKYSPKMAALCTTDFEANGKVYLAGNLYTPTDDDSRAKLLVANAADQGRITLGTTNWAFMRPFDESLSHTTVDEHCAYAASLPQVFDNHTFPYSYYENGKRQLNDITRHGYWLINKESNRDDNLVSAYNLQ